MSISALALGLVTWLGHLFFYQEVEAFHLVVDVRYVDVVFPSVAHGIQQVVRNYELHVVGESEQVVHHVPIELVAYPSFDALHDKSCGTIDAAFRSHVAMEYFLFSLEFCLGGILEECCKIYFHIVVLRLPLEPGLKLLILYLLSLPLSS